MPEDRKTMSKEEVAQFWSHVEKVAAEVRTWPDWKTGRASGDEARTAATAAPPARGLPATPAAAKKDLASK